MAGAVDNGGNVTNFTRNTRAFNHADAHNGTLERDDDKIPQGGEDKERQRYRSRLAPPRPVLEIYVIQAAERGGAGAVVPSWLHIDVINAWRYARSGVEPTGGDG